MLNNILRLIRNEEVKWARLENIFNVRTGYTPSKKNLDFWKNGVVNWFTIDDIRHKGRILDYANIKISESAVKKQPFSRDSIILSTIATIGEYALINCDFVVNQQFTVFTPNEKYLDKVDMKFMRYYFYKISEYCKKNKRVGNVPTIDTQKLKKIEIPIPSLETQRKIVDILDRYTKSYEELKECLAKEKDLRIKQYEYYRDKLLSEEYLIKKTKELCGEDAKVEWTNLGNICEILDYKRKPITKTKRIFGEYPYYGANGIQDYVNEYIFDGTYILMGEDGSVIKKDNTPILHYIENKKIWVNNHAHVLGQKEEIYNLRYIYYYLSQVDVSSIVRGVPPKINQANMREIKILLPPLKVQTHIVEILDKFDKLTNDIKEGLPKEIELRTKQYEYYREKLLSFNK